MLGVASFQALGMKLHTQKERQPVSGFRLELQTLYNTVTALRRYCQWRSNAPDRLMMRATDAQFLHAGYSGQ